MVQHPRGKVLRGSSAINLQALVYPSKATVDTMNELGIEGWDWAAMAPYYRKFHTLHDPKTVTHLHKYLDSGLGITSGPIQSSFPNELDPLHAAWIESLNTLQHGITGHPLDGKSIGAYALPCAVMAEARERSHSGNEYYGRAAHRSNLHLLTDTSVERIILNRDASGEYTTTGVVVSRHGSQRQVQARLEVILAAGAIGSPQLLELSGIGSGSLLQSHNIEVLIDNPNVDGTYLPLSKISISNFRPHRCHGFMNMTEWPFQACHFSSAKGCFSINIK